jgi:hypothetical protein
MNRGLRLALYGVGVWALPFSIGMLVFPLQESTPALFDTLMSIAVCGASVLFGGLYFRKRNAVSMSGAVRLGIAWIIICLLIDVPLFVVGFEMGVGSYFADIGLTYVIVPIIVVGMAYVYGSGQARQ